MLAPEVKAELLHLAQVNPQHAFDTGPFPAEGAR